VVEGATIPDAFTRTQLDGTLWHIGDHEEYTYEVIPAEAHDLPLGSISPIIPGDGGLHLFKIYGSKEFQPPADVVSSPLHEQLRRDAAIERPE
jgi:hypothetical protein